MATALALVLACLPVAMSPSPAVAILAAASLALSLAGVVMRLSPLVVAGVSAGWVAYVFALAATSPGLDLASAIAMGTGSFLLLETGDFAGRFSAVPLSRRVIVAQVRWWLTFCLAVAGLVVVVVGLATVVAQPLPAPIAAGAALAASTVVVVSLLRLVRD